MDKERADTICQALRNRGYSTFIREQTGKNKGHWKIVMKIERIKL